MFDAVFHWLLDCQILPVRLQELLIGEVKLNSFWRYISQIEQQIRSNQIREYCYCHN